MLFLGRSKGLLPFYNETGTAFIILWLSGQESSSAMIFFSVQNFPVAVKHPFGTSPAAHQNCSRGLWAHLQRTSGTAPKEDSWREGSGVWAQRETCS